MKERRKLLEEGKDASLNAETKTSLAEPASVTENTTRELDAETRRSRASS